MQKYVYFVTTLQHLFKMQERNTKTSKHTHTCAEAKPISEENIIQRRHARISSSFPRTNTREHKTTAKLFSWNTKKAIRNIRPIINLIKK